MTFSINSPQLPQREKKRDVMAVWVVFSLCVLSLAECRGLSRDSLSDSDRDICKLKPAAGPCFASIESWYYDSNENMCKQFVYGGCQGNDNRFETQEACRKRCHEGGLASSSDEFPHKSGQSEKQEEEDLPPCLLEKLMAEKNGPLIGAYVPQCDKDGYYELKQCWASTGSCWCVDKFGKKIKGEGASAGQHLECGAPVSPEQAPCFRALQQSLQPAILVHGFPQSMFGTNKKPECDDNGFFKPKQCDNSYFKNCWCTDKWGNKLKNTFGPRDEVFC